MSSEHFNRLKEISTTVVPNEISLMTHNENGLQDSMEIRGKNLKLLIIEERSKAHYNCQIKISNEMGLIVTIPCKGVEIIEESRLEDQLAADIYFFVNDGFAQLTIKWNEIIRQETDKDLVYKQLITQAKSCIKCVNMKDTEAVIDYSNGSLNADIMFIAEAPGPRGADVTGIPLHGDATGNNFEKLLASTRWTRSDIFITNAVLCCPTTEHGSVRRPDRIEVQNCQSYLERLIMLINPKVIVTLGVKALEALKEIENHQLVLNQDIATYTKWNNRWVYPLYHPSPQVINTSTRTMQQQRTDFMQLEQNYKHRIIKGKDPINYQRLETE